MVWARSAAEINQPWEKNHGHQYPKSGECPQNPHRQRRGCDVFARWWRRCWGRVMRARRLSPMRHCGSFILRILMRIPSRASTDNTIGSLGCDVGVQAPLFRGGLHNLHLQRRTRDFSLTIPERFADQLRFGQQWDVTDKTNIVDIDMIVSAQADLDPPLPEVTVGNAQFSGISSVATRSTSRSASRVCIPSRSPRLRRTRTLRRQYWAID